MARYIRKISFSGFRKHMGSEMKFVSEQTGHLWLLQHGKPQGVIIPMADEAILHRAVGLDPREAFHRAMVDCDRMIAAIDERERWVSTEVISKGGHGYPPKGLDDGTFRKWQRMVDPA